MKFDVTMTDKTTRTGRFEALNRGDAEKQAYNSAPTDKVWTKDDANSSSVVKKVVVVEVPAAS